MNKGEHRPQGITYSPTKMQSSPPFVKDIVARFSSYYARQDQPNINFSKLMN